MKPGERIKELRDGKGLNQKDFSKELRISQGFLSQVEGGIREPSRGLLGRMRKRYGISSDYILYGSGEEQKKYLMVREAEPSYEVIPTATKKIFKNVEEILESGNEVMIDLLKANIRGILMTVRNKNENEKKGGE